MDIDVDTIKVDWVDDYDDVGVDAVKVNRYDDVDANVDTGIMNFWMMMINYMTSMFSANNATSLAMMTQCVLTFTHEAFVEKPITSHKGVG